MNHPPRPVNRTQTLAEDFFIHLWSFALLASGGHKKQNIRHFAHQIICCSHLSVRRTKNQTSGISALLIECRRVQTPVTARAVCCPVSRSAPCLQNVIEAFAALKQSFDPVTSFLWSQGLKEFLQLCLNEAISPEIRLNLKTVKVLTSAQSSRILNLMTTLSREAQKRRLTFLVRVKDLFHSCLVLSPFYFQLRSDTICIEKHFYEIIQ